MSMSSDEESQVATEALGQSPSTATKLSIPTGISAPKALKREGNLATNWKKIKNIRRGWENYAIVTRLDRFDKCFNTGYCYQSSETNRERVVKLNKRKIALKKTYVPYIGHVLTSEGVKADPDKVEAIFKMDRPTDIAGVQRMKADHFQS